MLESLGYTVHAMNDGSEAVLFFKDGGGAVDLVILDMVMPGMSGAETFDRIRELNPQ